MKVLHTITDLGTRSGGTSSSVYAFLRGIREQGSDSCILTYIPEQNDTMIAGDDFIIAIARPHNSHFLYSNAYKKFLESTQAELFHTHGLWQYPSYITSKIGQKRNIPYVISPHGMLYPQALEKSALRKKIMLSLFFKGILQNTACAHVTCNEEMIHLRNLGITSPIAVIPNLIEIPEYPAEIFTKKKLCFGYLGRFHSRKKIEQLIYAWEKLGAKTTGKELIMIGSGDEQYFQFLEAEVRRLNIKNITFTGFLSGDEKESIMNTLSCLVVPSDFENFGMIVPEALIMGIPVIASKGTPWEELNTNQCGWWIDNDVETLATTIDIVMNTPEETRIKMGKNGQKLIIENYSKEIIAQKLMQLYNWILRKDAKPDFVHIYNS